MYIYQHKTWPHFTWNREKVMLMLMDIKYKQGLLLGKMQSLGLALQGEAQLDTVTLDVIKSNEIEGEILNSSEVRSSIARRLGMDIAGLVPSDRHIDGVVEMVLDAIQNCNQPLTQKRLFAWHAALFPTGTSGMQKITVGKWRNNLPADPMQVVSGAMGKERVHFEAPAAKVLPAEMKQFLAWLNTENSLDPLLKAGIAHLWFVTIHPFDDGNGRIARTIADMMLARADGVEQRFYSMSAQIRLQRKGYYEILEKTQKGTTDITKWLEWFLNCLNVSITTAEQNLVNVLNKAKFWKWLETVELNTRQKNIVNKMLDGFDGKLTSSKWAKINKCSQDTAQRDINNLLEKGVLVKEEGGGRSTAYALAVL